MNPNAEGLDKDRLPPLADVRRNLRIRWYRCPLEREKLPLLKLANLLFLVGLTAMGTLLGTGIFTPLLVWYLGS